MKAQLTIGIALGVVVLGVAWYAKRRAVDVAAAINPLSRENVFYQGSSAVAQAVTGDKNVSLGTAIWEFFNGEKEQQMMNELLSPVTLEPKR